jgi:hypothetical protein
MAWRASSIVFVERIVRPEAVPDEDTLLDERAGRPKLPLRFQNVHISEVVAYEGFDRAGRCSDAVDGNE